MKSKVFGAIILTFLAFYVLPGCRKTETTTVTKNDTVTVAIDTPGTPVDYYMKKITGLHNWVGTHWWPNHFTDTNFNFEITHITDSILTAHIDNRVETLYYVETNELEKIILFNGSYPDGMSNDFSYRLTYYYGSDSLTYDEQYMHFVYSTRWDELARLNLHRH